MWESMLYGTRAGGKGKIVAKGEQVPGEIPVKRLGNRKDRRMLFPVGSRVIRSVPILVDLLLNRTRYNGKCHA